MINKQGIKMKIIEYRGRADIDVEFENGEILYNKTYRSFKNGSLTSYINRIGESKINNRGELITIIRYGSSTDIDVEFEDGYKILSTSYAYFKNGSLYNKFNNKRLGEERIMNCGLKAKIIKYNKYNDIDVLFVDTNEIVKNISYKVFEEGAVKSIMQKTVCGVGFLGTKENVDNKAYDIWRGMLRRCYDNKSKLKNPAYKDCSVCEEWHNYSNFKKWYDENYYEIGDKRMHLDKDILIKGNKIYSPETCIFVPQFINLLFTKRNIARGEYPIGVATYKDDKFIVHCNDGNGNCIHLGIYDSREEAFLVYKEYKENIIYNIANKYKEMIPSELYKAMKEYKVDIFD